MNQRPIYSIFGGLLLCFLFASAAPAQPERGWGAAGIGASALSRGVGGSARLSGYLLYDKFAVSGRLTANAGGRSESGGRGIFAEYDEFRDLALVVGYAPSPRGNLQFIVGGGPAAVWGKRVNGDTDDTSGYFDFGPGRSERRHTRYLFGLALEAGAFGRFGRYVGYGFILHGNLNNDQPFVGLTVNLTAGKLTR